MRICRWYSLYSVALATLLLVGSAEARTVRVEVDSRKGIGLVPGFWRGMVTHGEVALSGLTWVRVDPALVRAAWRERVGGGGPGWHALEQAIATSRDAGLSVILTFPVAAAPDDEKAWRSRVEDTVKRTKDCVDRYEISAEGEPDVGRYLRYFESAVWAAYKGHHLASVGGPGTDWRAGLLEPLLRLCAARDLPIRFVSWTLSVQDAEDPLDAFHAAEASLDRVPLPERPESVVSGWGLNPGTDDPVYLTCSALRNMLAADLLSACMDPRTSPWGHAAFQAFGALGGVQIPMVFDGDSVDGLATMEGDVVTILVWRRSDTGPVDVALSLSGLRWGRSYGYERLLVESGRPAPREVERGALESADPLDIRFAVPPERATLVRIVPQ